MSYTCTTWLHLQGSGSFEPGKHTCLGWSAQKNIIARLTDQCHLASLSDRTLAGLSREGSTGKAGSAFWIFLQFARRTCACAAFLTPSKTSFMPCWSASRAALRVECSEHCEAMASASALAAAAAPSSWRTSWTNSDSFVHCSSSLFWTLVSRCFACKCHLQLSMEHQVAFFASCSSVHLTDSKRTMMYLLPQPEASPGALLA